MSELEISKIGIAVSDSPTGPFRDLTNHSILNPPYPIIDASVYSGDENNKCYLRYSRCCYKRPVENEIVDKVKKKGKFDEIEKGWMYGIELRPDFTGIISEPKLLLAPSTKLGDQQLEWESRSIASGEANRHRAEGSYIFKHDDLHYMIYSANSFGGAHYAVGHATARNPLGLLKEVKSNPVLQENMPKGGTVMGTDHGMLITIPDGKMYAVYHTRMQTDPLKRAIFIGQVTIRDGKLKVSGPTTSKQEIAH